MDLQYYFNFYGYNPQDMFVSRQTEEEQEISDIQSLIPEEATPENQLADKEYVNNEKDIVSSTYNELVEKRNTGKLVQGTWYRITDYTCTTTQNNTQSAGHQFDILIMADAENHLNENAFAALHEGDTYFTGCKLEAWNLKYCLDNDTNRFAWADTNGKGVVYWMKDEYENECGYDFKNIMFERWDITACVKCPDIKVDSANNTQGFFFGAKDIEGDNSINASIATYGANSGFFYTFSLKDLDSGNVFDYTVEEKRMQNNWCTYNKILPTYDDNKHFLSNNVFFSYCTDMSSDAEASCSHNVLHENCHSNTFGNGSLSNTMKFCCYNNVMGNGGFCNSFENYCFGNIFGNDCTYNHFGDVYYNNIAQTNLMCNSFGIYCESNTFGTHCNYNTFMSEFYNNSLESDIVDCVFMNSVHDNTIGNNVKLMVMEPGVRFCDITGGASNADVQQVHVLGVVGTANNRITITFTPGVAKHQWASMNSNNELKIWIPADLVP